jgi:hypothetical protein
MTELTWEGKYVDGKRQSPVRVALPFQTIETVNEGAADRRRTLDLFAAGRPTDCEIDSSGVTRNTYCHHYCQSLRGR